MFMLMNPSLSVARTSYSKLRAICLAALRLSRARDLLVDVVAGRKFRRHGCRRYLSIRALFHASSGPIPCLPVEDIELRRRLSANVRKQMCKPTKSVLNCHEKRRDG
jgi:hypothetical protein